MKTLRHRLDDNIKMRLTEMTWDGVDLIRLPQDSDMWRAVVKAVMKFRVLYNVLNLLTGFGTVSFAIRTVMHGVSGSVCLLVVFQSY